VLKLLLVTKQPQLAGQPTTLDHSFPPSHPTMTTYRITFKDLNNHESSLPVISTSAVQAVADLQTLGYKVRKVVHCFPSI